MFRDTFIQIKVVTESGKSVEIQDMSLHKLANAIKRQNIVFGTVESKAGLPTYVIGKKAEIRNCVSGTEPLLWPISTDFLKEALARAQDELGLPTNEAPGSLYVSLPETYAYQNKDDFYTHALTALNECEIQDAHSSKAKWVQANINGKGVLSAQHITLADAKDFAKQLKELGLDSALSTSEYGCNKHNLSVTINDIYSVVILKSAQRELAIIREKQLSPFK
jgi:hypothetical protein